MFFTHAKHYERRTRARGNPSDIQTWPAITHARTKRARTQIADRPECNSYRFPLALSLLKVCLTAWCLLFYLYSKNRCRPTPEMAFPHLAYIDEGNSLFATITHAERRYFRRRKLLHYAGRRPNGRDTMCHSASVAPFRESIYERSSHTDTKNPGLERPGLRINYLPLGGGIFAKNSE